MGDTITIRMAADLGDLRRGLEDGANAVRTSMDNVRSQMASSAEAVSSRAASIASGLDAASTAASTVAIAFDAMRMPAISDRAAALSGRIEEANNVVRLFGAGAEFASSQLGGVAAAEERAAQQTQELAKTSEEAAAAQADLNRESESSIGWWVAGAAAAAAIGLAIYGVYQATKEAEEAMSEAASAVADWAGRISGATATAQAFTAEAQAQRDTFRDLRLELGDSATALAHVNDVARDYQVSQGDADAVLRRFVDILEDTTGKHNDAREVLEAYIGSVSRFKGVDAPQVMDRFAKSLNETKDSTAKTNDVMAVFGSDGKKFLKGIAEGAGDMSHAFTEADRIHAAMAANIEESNKKIETGPKVGWLAEMSEWASGVGKRFDELITRSDKFKAEQEYALSHISIAWREYKADVASISDVWDSAKRSASEYFSVATQHNPDLQQWLGVQPIAVPNAPDDTRRDAPTRKGGPDKKALETGGSSEVQAYDEALAEMKAKKENWFAWDAEREAQFWEKAKKEYVDNWSEAMSMEDVVKTKGYKALDSKLSAARKEAVKEDLSGRLASLDAEAAEASKNADARLAVERQKLEAIKEIYGEDSTEYQQQQIKVLAAATKSAQQLLQIKQAAAQAEAKVAQYGLDAEADAIKARRQLGEISAVEELQQLGQVEERKRQAELQAAQARLTLLRTYGTQEAVEIERVEREITEIKARHQLERQKQLSQEAVLRQQQERDLAQVVAEAEVQAANDNLTRRQQDLSFRRQIGQISASEEIQQLRDAEAQKYQIELAAAQRRAELLRNNPVQHRQVLHQIEQLQRQHNMRMRQLDQQQTMAHRQQVMEWMAPIKTATQGMLQGMLQGTLTARQLVANFLTNIAASYAAKGLEIAGEWVANQIAMAIAGETAAAQQATAITTEAATAIAASKAMAASEIPAQAGIGAAAAMASVAAIPVVGWAMAPAVGAEHFAMAMSYLGMASAYGGAERVERDGQLFELHKDEMVLPAWLSNPLRDMVKSGGYGMPALARPSANDNVEEAVSKSAAKTAAAGGGGGAGKIVYSPSFSAVDASGMQKLLERHQSDLVRIVDGGKRKGMGKRK